MTQRDYKREYRKFQSSGIMKQYRAKLNKYNRDKGTYGNGDGLDASHKGGNIIGFESSSKNKGRAEKSRLKGSTRNYKTGGVTPAVILPGLIPRLIQLGFVAAGTTSVVAAIEQLDKKYGKNVGDKIINDPKYRNKLVRRQKRQDAYYERVDKTLRKLKLIPSKLKLGKELDDEGWLKEDTQERKDKTYNKGGSLSYLYYKTPEKESKSKSEKSSQESSQEKTLGTTSRITDSDKDGIPDYIDIDAGTGTGKKVEPEPWSSEELIPSYLKERFKNPQAKEGTKVSTTDRQIWDENRKDVKSKYKSFEEYKKAAEAYRKKQTGKKGMILKIGISLKKKNKKGTRMNKKDCGCKH